LGKLKFSAGRSKLYHSFRQSDCTVTETLYMQSNAIEPIDSASAHEPLLQFLYRAPLGLLQTTLDGTIKTINPLAASLLTPLSAGRLDNLFVALAGAAPQLRALVDAFGQAHGTVCESIQVPLAGLLNADMPQTLSVSLFKLDAARLVATVSGASFEPATRGRAPRRSGMEDELRQALAENQLFVQYQPVVGLRHEISGAGVLDRSAGVEALVRWNHRIRGAVSPLEFIGIAEECGFIGALSQFVLGTACRQFVQWREKAGSLAPRLLAVNLSRGQLAEPGFVALVRNILDSCGMAPEHLQLEVHESVTVEDGTLHARLQELKEIGVKLALDNFGVGRSSLVSLHLLPVDVIKIHRSLVTEAVVSEHHRVLIEATVLVAESLGMSAAAEGIETEAQLAVVRQLGCKQGQGYFFSEAISAANMVQWLTSD
jgi:EAL domain-containing protein (putative c-di-GMP-specific phosphodiesterase class I)